MRWDKICEAIGAAAGFVVGLFGGMDTMLYVLFAFIVIDYLTGLLRGWVGKSSKTESGHITSAAGWAGLAKKVGELIAVIVGVLLDKLALEQLGYQTAIFRTAMMMYIIVTEAISIMENLGALGVPLPKFVMTALEQLREKAEDKPEG